MSTDTASRPTVRRLLAGRAPAFPGHRHTLHATASAISVLLLLAATGSVLHEPMLIPPLAASAALVHSTPALPLAQPRSLIGGHLLSALAGYLVLALCGSSTWAAALAGGLALGTMMISRTPHSPAAATAVIVVLQAPAPLTFLPLLLTATVLLVAAGIVAGRAKRASRYPVYWW
ncbi:HPP family protein [Streptomyces sp. NBC_01304]|uniref:HPP family protein n=1 Tax=Streptomyces sp. NBC_01304 TaxID=2903818 RepID=UPI002E11D089|nr:HPP family protein [Streptomyces sp. NBC_01304]